MDDPQPPPDWLEPLRAALDGASMAALRAFLAEERAAGARIFPAERDWFRALELTPLQHVRVVILGQDPYHGPGQAHGLSFSVPAGVRPPPSLVNIFKELQRDCGIAPATHGLLDHWAAQGVLLLNSVLTVRERAAGSHAKRGWEQFTDAIVRAVATKPDPVVFLLWGAHAQKKAAFVEEAGEGGRHLVLKAPHPSPLSAHSGWFGGGHFSKTNAFLVAHGRPPIDWTLPAVAR